MTRFGVRQAYTGLVERSALTASGLAVFVPAAVLLTLDSGSSWRDWLALLLPLTAWSIAFAPPLKSRRPAVQTIAGLALMTMPVFLPGPAAWIQPTIIGFGVIVGAVFCMPPMRAGIVIVAAVALDIALSLLALPAVAFVDGSVLMRMAGPLLALLAGAGLVVTIRTWRRVIAETEVYEDRVRRFIADERDAEEGRRAGDAVRRRIHETVLNTLTAISFGLEQSSAAAARRACTRDLEQLGRGVDERGQLTLVEVVDAAARVGGAGLQVTIRRDGDALLEHAAASSLRDAIVEALRNVKRHSGVLAAQIHAMTAPRHVRVAIIDEGRGFGDEVSERFGMRQSLRAGIEAVGGRVDVESGPAGTTVIVTVERPDQFPGPDQPVRTLAESAPTGRLGLLGTNLYLAVMAFPATSNWPAAGWVRVVVSAFIVTNLVLAFAWTSRWRAPLAAIGTALAVALAIAMVPAAATCATEPMLGWLVLAVCGGGSMLLVLAQRSAVLAGAVVAVIALAFSALALQVPSPCSGFPWLAMAVSSTYLIAVAITMAFADGLLERRRTDAMRAWDAAAREQARAIASAHATETWRVVDEESREFLTDVAEGALDPCSPDARMRASALAAAVRSSLSDQPPASEPFQVAVEAMQAAAAESGSDLETEVTHHWVRADEFPDELVAACAHVVRTSIDSKVRVTALIDDGCEELTVRIVGDRRTQRPRLERQMRGDCELVIQTDPDEPGLVFVSLRRPKYAWVASKAGAFRE